VPHPASERDYCSNAILLSAKECHYRRWRGSLRPRPPMLKYEPGTIVAEGDFVIVHGRFSDFGLPVNRGGGHRSHQGWCSGRAFGRSAGPQPRLDSTPTHSRLKSLWRALNSKAHLDCPNQGRASAFGHIVPARSSSARQGARNRGYISAFHRGF